MQIWITQESGNFMQKDGAVFCRQGQGSYIQTCLYLTAPLGSDNYTCKDCFIVLTYSKHNKKAETYLLYIIIITQINYNGSTLVFNTVFCKHIIVYLCPHNSET